MAENGKAKYYALMEEMKTDILSGKIRPGEPRFPCRRRTVSISR